MQRPGQICPAFSLTGAAVQEIGVGASGENRGIRRQSSRGENRHHDGNKERDAGTLRGKRLDFSSVAEMITRRVMEIPDRVHVLYYDQKFTCAETNAHANRVANFLKSKGEGRGTP